MTIHRMILVESTPPYKMFVLTPDGIRAARTTEIFSALWVLHQNGNLGILRLLAIFVKKSIMSLFRSSQQQLFTDHIYTPEEWSMFKRWEKAIEGAHDLPQ